jgi:hypothetical protein
MNEINWDCLVDDKPSSEVSVVVSDAKPPSVIEKTSDVKQLDIEEARNLLPWEKVEEFKEQASNFEVVTFGDCEQALGMAMQSRKLSKAVESKRKEITKPHLDFQKGIKKIADAFIDELKAIEDSMTKKVEAFNDARNEKSKEIGVDLTTVDRVEDGISYEQEYFEFEISDISQIPKEYLKIDDRKIKQAISDGIRNISGLRIFKTKKKRYRIK